MSEIRLPDITTEVCRKMVKFKGSHAAAARALGISTSTVTARLNPFKNYVGTADGMTPWGYNPMAKSKMPWPKPYPPHEMEKWIKGALAGQRIIVATIPWQTFPVAVKYFLSRAARLDLIELHKGESRVEMTRL